MSKMNLLWACYYLVKWSFIDFSKHVKTSTDLTYLTDDWELF